MLCETLETACTCGRLRNSVTVRKRSRSVFPSWTSRVRVPPCPTFFASSSLERGASPFARSVLFRVGLADPVVPLIFLWNGMERKPCWAGSYVVDFVVARDGIEPPTPAFSEPAFSRAKCFQLSGKWRSAALTRIKAEPIGLTDAFYADPTRMIQWRAFVRRSRFHRTIWRSRTARIRSPRLRIPVSFGCGQ